ncbi:MAG: hypothetical protein D6780_07850 [Candidatus Dadabacteria bacterium]|nr:MAG: hypothetical protein D6780_07850 [Candidatus Dadabacteria bacterium]
MVFIEGPRQVGKTHLAKKLLKKNTWGRSYYLNWDYDEDREVILKRKWPIGKGMLVLDEIH